MNATQKKYAVGRLVTITVERAKKAIATFNELNKKHGKLKLVTSKDFIENPPNMLTLDELTPDSAASLTAVFDMSGLQSEAHTRYKEAMGDYDLSNCNSSYMYITDPLSGKQESLGYTHNALTSIINNLQNKLQTATDGIMLGGSDEAQAIIDNF